jgi:metal-responsive CopG/Arc/MetJ family transcriptional regulator
MKKLKLITYSFKLEESLDKEFELLVEEKSINKSELMRKLIKNWINENK